MGEFWVRFWSRVDKTESCWVWTAGRTAAGYGMSSRGGRHLYSHRLSYELAKGPIPAGLEIDHICRNRACVNPEHLRAVTHAENLRTGLGGHHHSIKTHCPQGHPYSPENTYVYKGRRNCRTCIRNRRIEHDRIYGRASRS